MPIRRMARLAALVFGLINGGLAVDDGLRDDFKDISPKEFLTTSVTLLTIAARVKSEGESSK